MWICGYTTHGPTYSRTHSRMPPMNARPSNKFTCVCVTHSHTNIKCSSGAVGNSVRVCACVRECSIRSACVFCALVIARAERTLVNRCRLVDLLLGELRV